MKTGAPIQPRPVAPPDLDGSLSGRKKGGRTVMGTDIAVFTTIPVILLILFTNLAVFIAIYTEKRLKTLRTAFVLSLAVADFLVGSIPLPIYVVTVYSPEDMKLCTTYAITMIFFMAASMNNLIAVSIERWIAIFKPLRYHNYITIRTVTVSLVAVWGCSFIFAIASVDLKKEPCQTVCKLYAQLKYGFTIFVAVAFFAFCAIMGYMQFKVFQVVQEHRRKVGPATNGKLSIPTRTRRSHQMRSLRDAVWRRRDMKMTVAVNTIYLAFVFTWSPQVLLFLLQALGLCVRCGIFVTIFGTLAALNSAVNPLVYAMRMSEFRRPIRRLFCLLCCCKRDTEVAFDLSDSKVSSVIRRESSGTMSIPGRKDSFLKVRSREGSDSSATSVTLSKEPYFIDNSRSLRRHSQTLESSTARKSSVTFHDSGFYSEHVPTDSTILEADNDSSERQSQDKVHKELTPVE